MHKTIDQLWTFYLTLWHCCNGELHGKDSNEARQIALQATQESAHQIYQESLNNISDNDAQILHHCPIDEILNWTKSHLDAYLATAKVILEQNTDPG
jgi:hypothetical protein